ncbi:MAG: YceI family protein [Bacteroidia bacterium]
MNKFWMLLLGALLSISWMGVQRFQNRAHQMTISGTSNLHDWSTNVTRVDLQAELELLNGYVSSVGMVQLSVPVASIRSDKGSVMDSKTREALQEAKHPVIRYQLRQVKIEEQPNKISKLKTEGSLTIAGATRQVQMDVFARQLPNNEVEVWGSHQLNMSNYKIKAPTALLGTIRTGDEISIAFSVILNK